MSMKKLFCGFVLILLLFSCDKDNKPATPKMDESAETEEPKLVAPTSKEVGEAYGVILADTVNQSEIKLDIEALKKSYNNALKKELKSEDTQAAINVLNTAAKFAYEAKKERIKKEGEDFLTNNAKRSEVVTLESGLQYEVLEEGSGEMPEKDATCKLHYTGKFIDGEEFENSRTYDDGNPIEINLNMVIPGWKEAIPHMKVGGKYKLFIPYNLAYGEQGVRSQMGEEVIPPCSTLIFEIELVGITPKETTEATN